MRITDRDRLRIMELLGALFKVSPLDMADIHGGFAVEWAAGGTTPIYVWSEGHRRVMSRFRLSPMRSQPPTQIPGGRGWHEECAYLLRRQLTPVSEREGTKEEPKT